MKAPRQKDSIRHFEKLFKTCPLCCTAVSSELKHSPEGTKEVIVTKEAHGSYKIRKALPQVYNGHKKLLESPSSSSWKVPLTRAPVGNLKEIIYQARLEWNHLFGSVIGFLSGMSRHLSTVPREKLPKHCLKELQLKGKDCVCEMLINIRRIRRWTTLRLRNRNTISEVTKEEKVGAWEMLGDKGIVNSDVCSTQKCRRCYCHEPKTTATKLWSSEFRGRKLNTINPTKHSFLG